MYKWKCPKPNCNYTFEHFLIRFHETCPKHKIELIPAPPEPILTHEVDKENLPVQTEFKPIYYGSQLWYFRRLPKNSKKNLIKAHLKLFRGSDQPKYS